MAAGGAGRVVRPVGVKKGVGSLLRKDSRPLSLSLFHPVTPSTSVVRRSCHCQLRPFKSLLCWPLVTPIMSAMTVRRKRGPTKHFRRESRVTRPRNRRASKRIWQETLQIARAIPSPDLAKLPPDLAANHDHYLYRSRLTPSVTVDS